MKTNCYLLFRFFLVFILLGVGGFPISGQDFFGQDEEFEVLGQISYMEGEVEVQRDEELLDSYDVDIGLEIENYDLIETGDSGFAEIEITTTESGGAVVRIDANTSFYFDIVKVQDKNQTRFQMLSGSLSLNVQRLAGGAQVKTQATVLGVRGTKFTATKTVDGSLLVTCSEGQVSCADDEGGEMIAEPGTAVEKVSGEEFSGIAVNVSELISFRESWIEERLQVFKSNALVAIKHYHGLYEDFLPRFRPAYSDLAQHREVLKKWAKEEDRMTGLGQLMQAKIKVSPAIMNMRSIFPLFEHVAYSLRDLDRFYDQGYGKGSIKPGYSTDQFFRQFKRDKDELFGQIKQVRYFFKLFARWPMSAGSDLFSPPSFDFGPSPSIKKGF